MQETNKNESSIIKTLMPVGVGIFICLIFLIIMSVKILHRNGGPSNIEMNSSASAPANICVCNNCGMWGLSHCFYCGGHMSWDKSQRTYRCLSCQKFGIPYCPNCGMVMQHRGTMVPGVQVPGFTRKSGVPQNPAVLTA